MDGVAFPPQALADRLKQLRLAAGLSLQDLAERSGVSRATLSRIENGEVSPTAETLGALASAHGMTVSRLLAPIDRPLAAHIPAGEQASWHDPAGGFSRTLVSPPNAGLSVEVVRCELSPGKTLRYDKPPVEGLEHHLVMLAGSLDIEVNGTLHSLSPGDCLRYRLHGPAGFAAGSKGATYLLVLA